MSKANEVLRVIKEDEHQPRIPGIGEEPTPETMRKLAKEANLYYGENENYLESEFHIYVDVSKMTEEQYDEMIAKAEAYERVGEGYEIFILYDNSGYTYWKDQSADENYPYLIVAVEITDPEIVNPQTLKSDVEDVEVEFSSYDMDRWEQ